MKRYIVALDEGTTSARAVVYDVARDEIKAIAANEYPLIYPQPGWVEADANDIWGAQYAALNEVIAKSGIRADEIYGIGVTNQRETVVIWDKKTGRPLHNAVIWQCRRTADYCEKLKENKTLAQTITKKTGLTLDAYFSATKLAWLLDNVTGARAMAQSGELLAGTMDSYIIFKLTGGVHVTDASNASRTMLFDINKMQWDEELLSCFDIPLNILPRVADSNEIVGVAAELKGNIPICGILGDQQSALFGQACFEKGQAKNTYGTGCFILMNTGDKPVYSTNNLISTVAWKIDGKASYALEGSVFNAGSAVQWLRDKLEFMRRSDESESLATLAKCSDGTEGTDGVYVVPAFTGLGAPYWNAQARGIITGVSRNTDKYHIVRATLESMAYSTMDVIQCMQADTLSPVTSLKVDGGAGANNFLMQFQADIVGIPVIRPKNTESTVMGAVFMCGMGTGVWKSCEQLSGLNRADRVFLPSMDEEKAERLYSGWRQAVKRAL